MSTTMIHDDFLDAQEFYELMQAYRHTDIASQNAVVKAFEAVKAHVRAKTAPDALLVDVLLLCTNCQQPIKARINTPNWLRVEWIGPEGECLRCFQEMKDANRN